MWVNQCVSRHEPIVLLLLTERKMTSTSIGKGNERADKREERAWGFVPLACQKKFRLECVFQELAVFKEQGVQCF